jgi:hypothetical protein
MGSRNIQLSGCRSILTLSAIRSNQFLEGSHNDQVFKWLCKLRELNQWNESQLREIADFVNQRILANSQPAHEIAALITQAMHYKPSGCDYSTGEPSISLTYDLSLLQDYLDRKAWECREERSAS